MNKNLRNKIDALLAEEEGAIIKRGRVSASICLAYPNTYHIGMSNLGLHRIYYLLNQRSETRCERVFLPDEQDIDEYRSSGARLFSLESKQPVKDFDILAFSVSFEQDYLNVLEMLSLAGIPFRAEDRSEQDPLLLLGGICSFFNPEPLSEFFDAVIVGEGEEVTAEFMNIFEKERDRGKRGLLQRLAEIPGVYIPSFYEVFYNEDGTIQERRAIEPTAPKLIKKRSAPNASSFASTVIHTPNTEFGSMHLAEVTRGCGRHCRFCLAGYIYLPPRNLPLAEALEQAKKAEKTCGKIGLVGSAISDYPYISDFCNMTDRGLSVSSLRADSVSEILIKRLAASGHKTVSIAPEAGSERLRKVINKNITESDILRTADLVFGSGIPNLKLYFIIGLPTETDDDIEAILMLTEKVHDIQLKHAKIYAKIGRITLSINSFIPKPFTPFQWEPMEETSRLNKKLRFLEKTIKKIGNVNLIHDLPKWEYFQALLSRGDRRICRLLETAHELSGDWKAAARKLDMNLDCYVHRRRGFDEILPWDFIDIGVRKDYLRSEYQRALEGRFTPPCSVGLCKSCGVCR